MVGVLGKRGKHGWSTLYVDDVKAFYLNEDIPHDYERREMAVRSISDIALISFLTNCNSTTPQNQMLLQIAWPIMLDTLLNDHSLRGIRTQGATFVR